MPGRLAREIQQKRPFQRLEEEAYVNILTTADFLGQTSAEALEAGGLSVSQYSALRILRGCYPDGLPCSVIGERMISRDPDITRLLDRLEKRGLIERRRDDKDRRVVITKITPAGLQLLEGLDHPMEQAIDSSLGHLGLERLRQLIDLLERIREGRLVAPR